MTRTTNDRHYDALVEHVETHVGPIAHVLNVPGPGLLHVDILHVAPTTRRRRHTLVTAGMSMRPMCPPTEAADCRFGELFLSLPADWPLVPGRPSPASPWVANLGDLARLAHHRESWLWEGHTVGSPHAGDELFNGSGFTAWIIGSHMSLTHEACVADLPDRVVHILSAIPIYPEELQVALRLGSGALFDMLWTMGVDDEVAVGRPGLRPRSRRRGRR
jgi:hypothetical protein